MMMNRFSFIVVIIALLAGCTPATPPEDEVHFAKTVGTYRYSSVFTKSQYGGFWKKDISIEDSEKIKISDDWVITLDVSDDEKWLAYNIRFSDEIYIVDNESNTVTLLESPTGTTLQIFKGWLYYINSENRQFERIDIANQNYEPEVILEDFGRTLKIETGYLKLEDSERNVHEFHLGAL